MEKAKVFYQVKPVPSIREMLSMAATENADTPAYIYKKSDDTPVTVTFSQFNDNTESLGAALEKASFGASHIACMSENRYEWIVTYLTVLKSAGVYIPLDSQLPVRDRLNLINDSDTEVLFVSGKYEDFARSNRVAMPNVKCIVSFDAADDDNGVFSYSRLVQSGEQLDKSAYDALKSEPDELKMLVYTSGTTGIAKGVMLTEHNLVSSVYYGLQVSQPLEKSLSVLPYTHTYESVCDLLVSIHHRTTLCLNRELKEIVRDLKFYKPSCMYIVPALAEVLYANISRTLKKQKKEKKFAFGVKLSKAMLKIGIDLRPKLFAELLEVFGGNLKKVVCGGAPIRPEIGEFFGNIGISLAGGYGITECSPLVCANNEIFCDHTTAGHRLPCLEWRIDEPGSDGIGEICVKGDVVMKGYYKQPEKTAEILRDGWFYTGDYGYINKNDMLVITGRKKNIIVLNNGKNIYPEEIEGYIQGLDCVAETVVSGLKNDKGDNYSLSAEVFPADAVSKDELLSLIRNALSELPDYKQVTKVVIRTEPFDKTTTNKIKRH